MTCGCMPQVQSCLAETGVAAEALEPVVSFGFKSQTAAPPRSAAKSNRANRPMRRMSVNAPSKFQGGCQVHEPLDGQLGDQADATALAPRHHHVQLPE